VFKKFDDELLNYSKTICMRVKQAEVERKFILNIIKEAKQVCFGFQGLQPPINNKQEPIVNVFGSM
jgi:hypothetical protein